MNENKYFLFPTNKVWKTKGRYYFGDILRNAFLTGDDSMYIDSYTHFIGLLAFNLQLLKERAVKILTLWECFWITYGWWLHYAGTQDWHQFLISVFLVFCRPHLCNCGWEYCYRKLRSKFHVDTCYHPLCASFNF